MVILIKKIGDNQVFKKIKIKLIKIYFNIFYIEYETDIINNELYVFENNILYDKLIYTTKKGRRYGY